MKDNNNNSLIAEDYQKAYDFLKFLIDCFYKECVNPSNEKFLKFLFVKNHTQHELDEFLNSWDIEAKNSNIVLFLANFMRENPNLEYNSYVKPRLEGLLNFFRFKNIKNLEFISKLIKLLNQNSVDFVALGDLIAKETVEGIINISNAEFCVTEKAFAKLPKLLKASDYEFNLNKKKKFIKITNDDGVTVLIEVAPDLDNNPVFSKEFTNILQKSQTTSSGNLRIPEFEHLAFIEMINLAKVIKYNLGFEKALLTIYKIINFVKAKSDFDWDLVIKNAESTKTGVQLKLSAIFLEEVAPDFLPAKLTEENLFKQEIIDYHAVSEFRKIYNEEIYPNYKKITLIYVIKNICMLLCNYLSSRVLYLKAKIIKKNPKLLSAYVKNMRKKNEIK